MMTINRLRHREKTGANLFGPTLCDCMRKEFRMRGTGADISGTSPGGHGTRRAADAMQISRSSETADMAEDITRGARRDHSWDRLAERLQLHCGA